MTGRAGGYCSGSAAPGFASTFTGRGGGFGYGRNCPAWRQSLGPDRRSWRNMAQATGLAGRLRGGFGLQRQADPVAEKNLLQNRAAALQSELDLINGRLQGIDTEKSEE